MELSAAMPHKSILEENKSYWTNRAKGYCAINRAELSTSQKEKWNRFLRRELNLHFADKTPLSVLEVGTGPGFFAILLAEAGFFVTAVDLTPAMLAEARENAEISGVSDRISFREMNAENLLFPDETFDVVISRNLTWDLPHPEIAYREWLRVLKKDGLLLNFDANWYHYLFFEDARTAYENDRENSRLAGISDRNVGKDFNIMEDIARRVPLSKIERPAWDIAVLTSLGISAHADETVWQELWSDADKISCSSTPMFLLRGVK